VGTVVGLGMLIAGLVYRQRRSGRWGCSGHQLPFLRLFVHSPGGRRV